MIRTLLSTPEASVTTWAAVRTFHPSPWRTIVPVPLPPRDRTSTTPLLRTSNASRDGGYRWLYRAYPATPRTANTRTRRTRPICPEVFGIEHARLIDRVLYWLKAGRHVSEPRRWLLLLLLIKWVLRLQPMSMLRGTDARSAASGDYDRVSPRRVGHYLRSRKLLTPAAWWDLAQEVNLGVFAGHGEAQQRDVFDFLSDAGGDVLYLDPPYAGTTSYEKEYLVLDRLLEGRMYQRSQFSGATPPLKELFRRAHHIPVWLVSFGNASIGLEELLTYIRRHRTVRRVLKLPYHHLASVASEDKNAENTEYIILAVP